MRYLSLFSGIEAATIAWKPLGWEAVAFSEIEPFPCALLEHHYPNVPNLGDITKITEEQIKSLGKIDVVIFGSPCQDLSVAGARAGLEGKRSGLFYDAIRIITWARKHCGLRFALWENVPGAMSCGKGADFAIVVGEMAGLSDVTVPTKGWGSEGVIASQETLVEWAILDAQWFGVAQRRRRVFAIADFGDWYSRPPILLEPESVRGNFTPSRGEGKEVAATLTRGFGEYGVDADQIAGGNYAISYGIQANIIGREIHNGGNGLGFSSEFSPTLTKMDRHAVAKCLTARGAGGGNQDTETANFLPSEIGVRSLTPLECERLQGFPDNFSAIPFKGKVASDTVRYKALGNSMAVPVINWIGRNLNNPSKFYNFMIKDK